MNTVRVLLIVNFYRTKGLEASYSPPLQKLSTSNFSQFASGICVFETNIYIIIYIHFLTLALIVTRVFLPPLRTGNQIKSDNAQSSNIRPLAHILHTCASIFSSCAIFSVQDSALFPIFLAAPPSFLCCQRPRTRPT